MSVAVVLVTLVGQAMLRDFLRVPNSDGVDGVGGHELAMDDVGQVMRLETACEAFAEAHGDRYPESLDELFRWWEVDRRRAMPVAAGEFVYVGAGLRRLAQDELNGPEAHPLRMPIVFVRKEPLEDGRRWIGVVRYSRNTGATHLLEPGDFEQYLVVNDEVRARRGLGAVAEEIRRSIRGTSAGAADAH